MNELLDKILMTISLIPSESLEPRFMQMALLGLLILAPMAATLGVQVINHRLAFFSDAVGHSAFTGVALGLLLSISPQVTMPIFGVMVGVGIMILLRGGRLTTDTVIGVVFSGVVAFGLAIVSREPNLARDLQRFLYGDILTISESEIGALALLFAVVMTFQAVGYNRLLYMGLNPLLAKVHGVRTTWYQYILSMVLSLVVVFSVWTVGVLLVTAMLVVPAATARNMSRTGGGMFWWAFIIGLVSAIVGLLISAQDWARTATGATVVLCSCTLFLISIPVTRIRRRGTT